MAHRKTKQHTVNVIKAQFAQADTISYLDLFEGYDELHILNSTDNLDFVISLLNEDNKAEIILGNPAIIPNTLENILAMQRDTLHELYKHERINSLPINLTVAIYPCIWLMKRYILKNYTA